MHVFAGDTPGPMLRAGATPSPFVITPIWAPLRLSNTFRGLYYGNTWSICHTCSTNPTVINYILHPPDWFYRFSDYLIILFYGFFSFFPLRLFIVIVCVIQMKPASISFWTHTQLLHLVTCFEPSRGKSWVCVCPRRHCSSCRRRLSPSRADMLSATCVSLSSWINPSQTNTHALRSFTSISRTKNAAASDKNERSRHNRLDCTACTVNKHT